MSKNILITLVVLMISNTLYAEANPICNKALDAIPKYESSKKMFNGPCPEFRWSLIRRTRVV